MAEVLVKGARESKYTNIGSLRQVEDATVSTQAGFKQRTVLNSLAADLVKHTKFLLKYGYA